MIHVRVIGDVHCYLHFRGSSRSYFNLIGGAEHSVQLGDLGFQWKGCSGFHTDMESVDKTRHVVILGNHDDYSHRVPNALGDFGVHTFPGFEFFYIRGARSIDRAERTPTVDWWLEEELTWEQGYECVQAFRDKKPEIVLSHDCPEEALYLMGSDPNLKGRKDRMQRGMSTSVTNQIMQSCLEVHAPRLWIFAHHHINWRYAYKGTTFFCLDGHMPTIGHNMAYLDFDKTGNLLTPFPQ